ncbi:MAG: Metallo-beta-lactamase superfamily protein [Actinomycetia bacterium]|nr:Metallo-beta-lactamase superfamily protein [Actinomycetes bacterium]
MARLTDRHPENVEGPWYVDTRCFDCDVARHHAPELIATLADGQSVVSRQPETPAEELEMWRAALACPTRSIGTVDRRPAPADVYPWELTPGVFLCGHNDRRSFGAHAWFMPRPGGGILVDAPHWDREVVAAMESRSGVAHVLLTHRDDIADAQRFAEHFGARVWIHEADADAAPFATDILVGIEEVEVGPGIVAFPVPGHTRGSVFFVVDDRVLFGGDTLAWIWRAGDLGAFRNATWYSWAELRASLERFASSPHRFEWICPGHGKWHGAPADEMHQRLRALVARI